MYTLISDHSVLEEFEKCPITIDMDFDWYFCESEHIQTSSDTLETHVRALGFFSPQQTQTKASV